MNSSSHENRSGAGGKDYIFVSHSSRDTAEVRRLVEFLEASGVPCWVSYRDIPPGADWAETIYDAIEASSGMLLLYSENTNRSRQVRNELDIATNTEIDIIPVRMDTSPLGKGVKYFTNSHQWLDASGGWRSISGRLLNAIGPLLEQTLSAEAFQQEGKRSPLLKKWSLTLLPLLVLTAVLSVILFQQNGQTPEISLNLVAGGTDSWDYATDLLVNADGSYTVTGTWDWGFWSLWWVAGIDSTGSVNWVWSDSLSGEDKPRLLPASGGDVIAAAAMYSDWEHTGFPLRVIRLSPSGSARWEKEHWLEWDFAVQAEMASMEADSSGTIHLFYTMRQLNGNGSFACHHIMLDSSGELAGRDTLLNCKTAMLLMVLHDDCILRAFRVRESRGNGIQIVSPRGEELQRVVMGDVRSSVTGGCELQDGRIVILMTRDSYGAGNGDLAVMCFDPDLQLLWERVFGGELADSASDVLLLPSGKLLIAGSTRSRGNGSSDGWLLMLDDSGNQLWQRTMDLGGDEFISSIALHPSGGYVITGTTTMFGQPDAWIMETDENGSNAGEPVLGTTLFSEDWNSGYVDQTLWELGYNRNYTPSVRRDSTTGAYSFDANNVPVVSIQRFPRVPGLCLTAVVTVPDMQYARGNNWLAVGLTGNDASDLLLDPAMIRDAEFRWQYTSPGPDHPCGLEATCISAGSLSSLSSPDSLWMKKGCPQKLTIENCAGSVRFLVNDSLFFEDSVSWSSSDSLAIYLWGSSPSLPHGIDSLRLYMRQW